MRCGKFECNGYHLRIIQETINTQLLRCDRCGTWYKAIAKPITEAQATTY